MTISRNIYHSYSYTWCAVAEGRLVQDKTHSDVAVVEELEQDAEANDDVPEVADDGVGCDEPAAKAELPRTFQIEAAEYAGVVLRVPFPLKLVHLHKDGLLNGGVAWILLASITSVE